MNIRQAILAAADSIEQNPDMFNFMANERPDLSCGTPGCALGWIGFYLGVGTARSMPTPTARAMGCPKMSLPSSVSGERYEDWGFYRRMYKLYGGYGWKHAAPKCAETLRLYADRYHAENNIPKVVTDIFNVREAA